MLAAAAAGGLATSLAAAAAGGLATLLAAAAGGGLSMASVHACREGERVARDGEGYALCGEVFFGQAMELTE